MQIVRPPTEGGYGLDGLWNDDFHHSAVVALTGRREAYFTDHRGTPQEFISGGEVRIPLSGPALRDGRSRLADRERDGLDPAVFVNFIENHDQIANSGDGSRIHTRTSPGRYRAMTALFILMPGTPMLFQGQEFGVVFAVPVLRRSQTGACRRGPEGPGRVHVAVPKHGVSRRAAPPAGRRTTRRRSSGRSSTGANTTVMRAHRQLYEDLIALRRGRPGFRGDARRIGRRCRARSGGVRASLRRRCARRRAAAVRQPRARSRCRVVRRTAGRRRLMVAPGAWSGRAKNPRYGGGGTPEVVGDHGLDAARAFCRGPRNRSDVMAVIETSERRAGAPRPVGADRGGTSRPVVEGMAGHQRAWRVRDRHRIRFDHAAVPRPAHRRTADAVRPHDDAQLLVGAASVSRRPCGLSASGLGRRAAACRSTHRRTSSGFRLEAGLPDVGVRGRRRPLREAGADAASAEHDPRLVLACCRRSPCVSSCGR